LNSNLVLILQQSKNHTDIKDNNVAMLESEVVHILMSAADFTYRPVSIKIDKSDFQEVEKILCASSIYL